MLYAILLTIKHINCWLKNINCLIEYIKHKHPISGNRKKFLEPMPGSDYYIIVHTFRYIGFAFRDALW